MSGGMAMRIICSQFDMIKQYNKGLLWVHFLVVSCTGVETIVPSYDTTSQDDDYPDNGIPVVEITTCDGKGITDKTTWKDATIMINGAGDLQGMQVTQASLKGRGNSTFKYPKKAFNVRLNDKRSLLGMPNSKKWVFLANYRDPTLLRNDVSLYLGRTFATALEWTPRGEFVDLVFNGNYVGNYYVCEKINVNKQHVDIEEMTSSDIEGEALTGGYLLEFDKYFDAENRFRSTLCNIPIGIVSPSVENCQPEHVAYIKSFVYEVESLLKEGRFQELYEKYLDLPSFVDYYLMETFFGNKDFAAPHSVYLYKKRGGKMYAGPLWDFDYSTFYNDNEGMNTKAWWYKFLLLDSHFVSSLKNRWAEISPLLESKALLYLEQKKNYIFLSAMDNFSHFPYNPEVNHNNLVDSGFLLAYKHMRYTLTQRVAYISERLSEL